MASRPAHDPYGQLRRVVHIVRGAPVMLLFKMWTYVVLVYGALGRVVAAILREGAGNTGADLRRAALASQIK